MTPFDAQRLAKFRESIQFDEAIGRVDTAKAVVLDWPLPPVWPLGEKKWEIVADEIYPQPGAALHKWVLQSGEKTLIAEIFVSSNGVRPAQENLLAIATNNMMVTPPYVHGPVDLGHLSLRHANPKVQELLWVFYNVCIHLNSEDPRLEVLPLARFFQELMNSAIVSDLPQHLPKLEKIEIKAEPITPGENIKARLVVAPGEEQTVLKTEVRFSTEMLNLLDSRALEADFRAQEPGLGQVQFLVVNRKNLLSRTAAARIEIVEERK